MLKLVKQAKPGLLGKPGETAEQITAVPQEPQKIKDPKRIEAGKKLAAYNRKAKTLMKKKNEEAIEESSSSWIPEINITLLVAIFGLGLTAIELFFRYKESIKMTKIVPAKHKLIETYEEPERKFGME